MFTFTDLAVPIVQAPMAGGPSTPELAAAVSEAGGLGFLAAGYKGADQVAGEIDATARLSQKPFGVNLFVPHASVADAGQVEAYRVELAPEAARYGVELGIVPDEVDDDWDAKIDLLATSHSAVVSFTFGLPSGEVVDRLHRSGVFLIATVTTAAEAASAQARGVDALCVQGPDAGGHRGTFDPAAVPSDTPLDELLSEIGAVTSLPLVAAGGISNRNDVRRVLALGAVAAQAGTAFLRSIEAGTKPAHRDALASPSFDRTVMTSGFSGRYARALVNRFVTEHAGTAPLGYPQIHYVTSPLRAAAASAGDADGLNLWAGTGFAQAQSASAGEIVGALTP